MTAAEEAGDSKRTGLVRGQHGDDIVCAGRALFGRRSHGASSSCQFSQGVGADHVITRTWAEYNTAWQADLPEVEPAHGEAALHEVGGHGPAPESKKRQGARGSAGECSERCYMFPRPMNPTLLRTPGYTLSRDNLLRHATNFLASLAKRRARAVGADKARVNIISEK